MKEKKQIGAGNDKNIFLNPANPEKRVVVIFRKQLTDEQLESALYLNKIMQLFFPQNIPKVYYAVNKGEESAMDVERIRFDSLHAKLSELMIGHYKVPLGEKNDLSETDQILLQSLIDKRHKDPKVLKLLKVTLEKGFILDIAGQNFSIDESSGDVKYFDVDPAWEYEDDGSITMNFNKDKLFSAITASPEELQKEAMGYFNHLISLFENNSNNKGKNINIKKQTMNHNTG